MKKEVNVERLINEFTDMADRKSLLSGHVTQDDLLAQITGTIFKVALESDEKNDDNIMDKYRHGVPVHVMPPTTATKYYGDSWPVIVLPDAIYDKYKDSEFDGLFIKSRDSSVADICDYTYCIRTNRHLDHNNSAVFITPDLFPKFGVGAVLLSKEWLPNKATTAIRITESLTRTVLVDKDYEDAEDMVADAYYKGVVMLTPENSTVDLTIEDDTENYKKLFGDNIFDHLEVSEEFKDKKE